MDNHLDNMVDALGLEVAKIKQRGSSTQIELRGGERLGTAESTYLYRFPLHEELNLRDDTPVRVVCDRVETSGTIVSLSKGSITIALEDDLGPKIPLARLVADDSFLIEKLREKLEEIKQGTLHFNHQLAASIIGKASPVSASQEPEPEVFINANLNEHQEKAVRLAFGSKTSFIWGPPGTGKTTTLGHIVEAHYRIGRSVLIVSNTNIAVDTALEKIAQRLEEEPSFYEGAVLRHGPLVKDEVKKRYGDCVSIDKVVERLGAKLESQKQVLQNELLEKRRELGRVEEALRHFEELDHLRSDLQKLEKTILAKENHIQDLDRELQDGKAKLSKLQINLNRALELGSIRRLLAGLNPQRIDSEIRLQLGTNESLESAINVATKRLREQELELERLGRDWNKAKSRVANYASVSKVRALLDDIERSIAQLQSKLRTIEDQLVALRQEVLNNCRILATTVYRTYLKGQVNRTFDVVIVDEASMLMLPMTFFAAGLATETVVVAGDFRQLAPIVTSDDPLALKWLKKDAFEASGIPREVISGIVPKYLAVLGEQYRMHSRICDCVNAVFYYDHPLTTNRKAGLDSDRFPFGDGELLYVDTSLMNPWSAFKLGSYSRYNLLHALLVTKLATCLDQNLLGEAGHPSLGIIAPYSAQTNLLQALLNDRLPGRGSELAATVHRFQGNERDSIIVDLTDSVGTPLSHFMKAVSGEDDGARLLNVAISRARHRVVLLANFGFLRNKAPSGGKLEDLLEYFEGHGEPIRASELLNLGQEEWSDGISHLGHIGGFGFSDDDVQFFTEGSFYPRFTQDIKEAQLSILIFSPFLTERGTSRWIELLRFAINRDVRVRLVTRPPGDQGGILEDGLPQTVRAIRELGIPVDHRARIHEKIAIIDGEILWHGSLNILSHRDTTESMLRIRSSSACARLASYVTTSTARKPQPNICDAENPGCPDCSEPTVWKNGRYGVYFECDSCGTKIDLRRQYQPGTRRPLARGRARRSSANDNSKPCPRAGCGGRLVLRTGPRGPFLGCTNYRTKNCRASENI